MFSYIKEYRDRNVPYDIVHVGMTTGKDLTQDASMVEAYTRWATEIIGKDAPVKTRRRTEGKKTYFIVSDVDAVYREALRELEFLQVEDGFARVFASDSPHLDRAYDNFARYAEEMILQFARVHPVPWEQALLTTLERIQTYPVLNWYFVGSTALAVRGLDVAPRDIDLVADDEGAHTLNTILQDYLIEPLQDSRGWISNWFGRAFVYARVEWVGGVDPGVDTPDITDFGPTAASRLETINWRGHQLRVPPFDLQLRVSERRGLHDRAEKIRKVL